ncbi:MAG: sugar phosphate isomerase/epimerase family protein [Gemmataceae bacterium]
MPEAPHDRRTFLTALAGLALAAAPPRRGRMTLGFSTYGMPGWTAERAIDAVAAAGFDTFELCLLPACDSAPARMPADRLRALRRRFTGLGLGLTALMESLTPSADDRADAAARERLKRAAEIAHGLCPDRPPLVETVLGGGVWEKVRGVCRDRLGGWVEALGGITLAIKPHRSGAMSLPAHAAWLIGQVGSPRLKLVYDQSHYEQRGHRLDGLLESAGRHVAFVAVKDVVVKGGKAAFELPGAAGTVDHAAVFRGLAARGYAGDVNCEASGMVSGRPGYDAEAAARACFEKVSRSMRAAGVRGAGY